MVCPDCQVLIVKNIKTYDQVQHSQKSLAKYSTMLSLHVSCTERDGFLIDENDEEIEKDEAEAVPTPKFRNVPKKLKIKVKPAFAIYEDIEFFHFEKKKWWQARSSQNRKVENFQFLLPSQFRRKCCK